MVELNEQFFALGMDIGRRGVQQARQRKATAALELKEQESAQFLMDIFRAEQKEVQSRAQGAQVLGQMRLLAGEPPAIRKANAPVLFQAFEREFGAPIAKNIQDMITKAPSEDVVPILDEIINQYRQNPNANVDQLNQVLANPIAAVHQIGMLSKKVQSRNDLDAPTSGPKIDPNQQRLQVLERRRERLQLAAFSPRVSDKQKPIVFKMIDRINDEIKELQPSKKDDKGAFGSSLTGLSQEMLVRNREILEGGGSLTPRQAMEGQFARSNLTAPRDTIRTDPVTGQKEIVTIRPQLPEGFQKPSPRVQVEELEPELSPKQLRVQAQQDIKSFSSAEKKIKDLATFVNNNPSVVGLTGQALNVAGAVTSAVSGKDVGRKKKVFDSKLVSLRSDLKPLIDKGRFSDEDQRRLELLVTGSGLLDTPEGTLSVYKEVLEMIIGKIDSAKGVLKQEGQPFKFRRFK